MDDFLIIGAGPAGLLAAWVARRRGAKVRVLAAGIGTTHISPGWIGVLDAVGDPSTSVRLSAHAEGSGQALAAALDGWSAAHPAHPYALAGRDALASGVAALREVCAPAGLNYLGDLSGNFRLPTALGVALPAAFVPESFAAGDLRRTGAMLIAGPADWRDFYPKLCADNLARQGITAQSAAFDLPEMAAASRFDLTPVGLARLFEQAEVRARVAAQLKSRLAGAARVGLPAVLGLTQHAEAWRDLQDRLGVPVFEIPTLPPSVPGMRLFNACKAALTRAGVPILLDMTAVRGETTAGRATGVVVPNVVREATYRADTIILATGGLYGGGITSNHRGELREAVFGLPVHAPGGLGDWFDAKFLAESGHAAHYAGVRANARLQPVDEAGNVVLDNVRIAGRLLAGYNPVIEGSTEGVWLATGYRAAA
jgi:glycerol-3-phosphate dehydrogenase subunit B